MASAPLTAPNQLPRSARYLANASWAVLALTFVGLLGGIHPSDALRDRVLLFASALLVLINGPAVWHLLKGRGTTLDVGGLMFRGCAAFATLQFVAGIHHG